MVVTLITVSIQEIGLRLVLLHLRGILTFTSLPLLRIWTALSGNRFEVLKLVVTGVTCLCVTWWVMLRTVSRLLAKWKLTARGFGRMEVSEHSCLFLGNLLSLC